MGYDIWLKFSAGADATHEALVERFRDNGGHVTEQRRASAPEKCWTSVRYSEFDFSVTIPSDSIAQACIGFSFAMSPESMCEELREVAMLAGRLGCDAYDPQCCCSVTSRNLGRIVDSHRAASSLGKSLFGASVTEPKPTSITGRPDGSGRADHIMTHDEREVREQMRWRGKPRQELLAQPVEALELSHRANRDFPRAGLTHVRDLVLVTKEDLMRNVPSLGPKTLRNVRQSLAAMRLALRHEHRFGTELHAAAFEGRTEDVKRLLDAGSDVDARDSDGFTPLLCAAGGAHMPSVEALLEGGANINAGDCEGLTALHVAACAGAVDIVALLIARGGETEVHGPGGATPLDLAQASEQEDVVALFRRHTPRRSGDA